MAAGMERAGFFFREKPVLAILALSQGKEPWYASSLAKEIDCTFPHIISVLSSFRALGLVSFKTEGRKKLVFLTPKGNQTSRDFARVLSGLK